MGFSASATHLVFIAAFLIIGSATYSVLAPTFDSVLDSGDEHSDLMEDQMRTAFMIGSTAVYPDVEDYDLQVNMTNTGTISIDITKLTVLVDGEPQNYVSGAALWSPEEITDIWLFDLPKTGGDHRIKVVAENGVAAYATYVG